MNVLVAADASPSRTARIAGALYLLVFAAGAVAVQRVPLMVRGDAAATAANILAAEPLYRLSVVASLVASLCYGGLALSLYKLFRPVSRPVSLLAAFFALAGCVVGAAVSFALLAPLVLLGGGTDLAAFSADQLQALALLFVRLYGQGETVGFVFFACYCLALGYLAARSAFLPRLLGALLLVAGLGWLVGSLASLLGTTLSPLLSAPVAPALGQLPLTLWLLARGVDARRWAEQASPAAGKRA
jgi:hypothetical protein